MTKTKTKKVTTRPVKVRLPDVHVSGYGGSVMLVTPNTIAVKTWLQENVDPEAIWLGPSLAVEARFVPNLLEGIREAGFEV